MKLRVNFKRIENHTNENCTSQTEINVEPQYQIMTNASSSLHAHLTYTLRTETVQRYK